MTQDFFLGQLRLIMVGVIAYCAGKGWLSTDTTTLMGSLLAPVGLLFGPWLWSIYHNINMKLVPKNSVAIEADNLHGVATEGGKATVVATDGAKIVG